MAIRPRLIAYAEPQHEPTLRAMLAHNACELVGVCAPRSSDATALAQSMESHALTDLRQAVLSPDTEAVWLATPVTIDPALRRAIREHGILVLSSEPLPALLAQHAGEAHEADIVTFAPAFIDSAGFASAFDSIEQFGPCRAMNLVITSRPEHGSLFARLFDAMICVRKLLGEAEQVDATMNITRANVPEQLAGLEGTMTLNLRIEGQRVASVIVSNEAPQWRREAIVIGESQHAMHITEDAMLWIGADSETDAAPLHAAHHTHEPGSLIAERLLRLLELPAESRSHGEGAQLLAMCEAARLSAKVGFSEAPGTISRMMSRP